MIDISILNEINDLDIKEDDDNLTTEETYNIISREFYHYLDCVHDFFIYHFNLSADWQSKTDKNLSFCRRGINLKMIDQKRKDKNQYKYYKSEDIYIDDDDLIVKDFIDTLTRKEKLLLQAKMQNLSIKDIVIYCNFSKRQYYNVLNDLKCKARHYFNYDL